MEKVKPSLELEDEISLHEKGWIAQRIGWVFLLIIFLSACLGVFGTGPLSRQSIVEDETTIAFERFARFQSPMTVSISAANAGEGITVKISRAYLEQMKLSEIMPSPASEVIGEDGTVYTFQAEAATTIKFYLEPETTGTIEGVFTVNGTTLNLTHLIYP